MGWDISPLIFIDDGYSAKSTDRPQLNKLLAKFNKECSSRSVKLMLTNPEYKGTLVWNRVDSNKKSRKEKDESFLKLILQYIF